jgi:transcription initiation factor TFIIIB Brf1 subunit/transcription initiation factor TFIIB
MYMTVTKFITKCPECKKENLTNISKKIFNGDVELNEAICKNCGFVIKETCVHAGCGGEVERTYLIPEKDSITGFGVTGTQTWDCKKCKKHWESWIHVD